MKIDKILAREILDSRGNPTVEVELTSGKNIVSASVPSGASTGVYEAVELRDGDKKRYGGKGVLKAVDNVNKTIAKKIVGKKFFAQKKIDKFLLELDGTENKSKLGANAILAVSVAFSKAIAKVKKQELFQYFGKISGHDKFFAPTPMFNILNGGKHADTNVDIQEFMVVPNEKNSFNKKLQLGAEIFHTLSDIFKRSGFDTDVGNEGGYAPDFESHNQVFEMIIKAGKNAGYNPGKDFKIAIDAAASSFYEENKKRYFFGMDDKVMSKKELIEIYKEWVKKYPLFSIEDGIREDDFRGWKEMAEILPKMQIVADDLTTTNPSRLRKTIRINCANAIIIKPNQIGTVTEAIDCAKRTKKAGWRIIASHRSGETCDDFLADFAVGIGADFIKAGAPSRGERVAKYNRLLKIAGIIDII